MDAYRFYCYKDGPSDIRDYIDGVSLDTSYLGTECNQVYITLYITDYDTSIALYELILDYLRDNCPYDPYEYDHRDDAYWGARIHENEYDYGLSVNKFDEYYFTIRMPPG